MILAGCAKSPPMAETLPEPSEPTPTAEAVVETPQQSVDTTAAPTSAATYTLTRQIHESMPEYTFTLNIIPETWLDYGSYTTDIEIRDESGAVLQVLEDLHTVFSPREDERVLEFGDWNFDGYLDISIWKHPGGSARNDPHFYWIWDATAGGCVEAERLSEMSEYSTLTFYAEEQVIGSFTRSGIEHYGTAWYRYVGDELEEYMLIYAYGETMYNEDGEAIGVDWQNTTEELMNGEWVVTNETHEEILYD